MANMKAGLVKRLNKLITDLKMQRSSEQLNNVLWKLEDIRDGKQEPKIKPITLYLEVIESIKSAFGDTTVYENLLQNAEEIYDELFFMGEDTPDFKEKEGVFRALAFGNGLAAQGFYDRAFFYSFADKNSYVTLVKIILSKKNGPGIFNRVRRYGVEVREYLVDDMGYLTHLIKIVDRMAFIQPEGMDEFLAQETIKLQRFNGIYDIDPVKLAQVEKNVSEAAATIACGKDMLQLLDRKCHTMEGMAKMLEETAQEVRDSTALFLDNRASSAKEQLEESIRLYEEGQKKAAFLEKELFMKQVFSDAESEISKYKAQAKTVTATMATQVQSLGRDVDDAIHRLKSATHDNEELKKVLAQTRQDEDMLKMMDQLSRLTKEDLDALASIRGRGPQPFGMAEVPEFGPDGEPIPGPEGMPHGPEEYPGMPHGPEGRPGMPYGRPPRRPQRPIGAVNPLLDPSVPFKQRFAIVKKEKERRMKEGELFHEMFDDVITALMENVNPYLIGPSGCGKTYMVKQIGEILNLDCTDIGYINEEYDLLGYVTAMGDYSESNFYRLYKYGGIAFCDELDNGNGKATVKLNSFLSNQLGSYYNFPGGERVDRHPNFRVIAAGNTDGNGADVNYVTREKIEESVQQRMIPIYVDYDNRVEKAILKDYPEWFEFACAFRDATTKWSEDCGIPAQGIFTTRDAYRIKLYMDNKSFTPEKIMTYEFVQTKEPEYLGFLCEEMGKKIKEKSKARELYKIFAEQIEGIRKRGKRV